MGDFVKIGSFLNFELNDSYIKFFVGFQNITKLIKLAKHNLNYRHLKLNLMYLCADVIKQVQKVSSQYFETLG